MFQHQTQRLNLKVFRTDVIKHKRYLLFIAEDYFLHIDSFCLKKATEEKKLDCFSSVPNVWRVNKTYFRFCEKFLDYFILRMVTPTTIYFCIVTVKLNQLKPQKCSVMTTSLMTACVRCRTAVFQGFSPPKHMYLTSRYSLMPCLEPSQPRPDCLTPPNDASGVDSRPSLMPTIPTSNASATRQIWLTSCE